MGGRVQTIRRWKRRRLREEDRIKKRGIENRGRGGQSKGEEKGNKEREAGKRRGENEEEEEQGGPKTRGGGRSGRKN